MLYAIADSSEEEYIELAIGSWSGSCFGMSLTCALDQLGYLDFNNRFANASKMSSVPSLRAYSSEFHKRTTDHQLRIYMSEAESAINFYQLLQYLIDKTDYENYGGTCSYDSTGTTISGLNTFVEATRRSGLALFGFLFTISGDVTQQTYGHAILVFGPPKLNGSYYEYTAYDPNCPELVTLRVSTNYQEYELSSMPGIIIGDISYLTNFNIISSHNSDLDGSYNTGSTIIDNQIVTVMDENSEDSANNIQISENEIDEEETVVLDVYLTNANYTITNAEGETITITDGLYVGGTMPVLGRVFRGEGPVMLTLTVPFSESFTFSGDNSERENFYRVIWGEQFSGAKGTGMEAVTITQSNVQLTGDNMEYLIRYSFAPEASYKAYLSGSDETFVMFEQTEDGFRATTENDAQFEIENLETQTVVLSESVAANSSYFLNYQINDQGVVSFETT